MARYLVTGGCGFIGSHLCDALIEQGHEVCVLDNLSTGKRSNLNPAAELIVGDVANRDTVRQAFNQVDGCFHLAAIASVERANNEWSHCHATNLSAAVNLFEAAKGTDKGVPRPVVYASSAAVYGDTAEMPLTESASTRPLTAYGADKLGCELHARVAGRIHNVPTCGLRFFNVYGPRQDPKSPYSGVISIFAERILHNRPVHIHGDGQQVRDFVYVSDVVRFLLAGMKKASPSALVCNVSTGTGTSILQLARTLAAIEGRPLQKVLQPARPGDIHVSLGDAGLAACRLGVVTATSLGQGLQATLRSLRPAKRQEHLIHGAPCLVGSLDGYS